MKTINFKDLIIKRLNQTLGFYKQYDTPSILMRLCKKYPQHRILWWFIWQIKEMSFYLILFYLLFAFSSICNPYVICYDCLQLVNNTYNVSALNNSDLITNFTSNFFENISVII